MLGGLLVLVLDTANMLCGQTCSPFRHHWVRLQDALPQAALSRVPKSLPMDALFSFSVPARVDSQPVRSKGGHPSTEPGEASLCRQLQHSCCRWAVKGFEGVWDLPQLSCISCQQHVVL